MFASSKPGFSLLALAMLACSGCMTCYPPMTGFMSPYAECVNCDPGDPCNPTGCGPRCAQRKQARDLRKLNRNMNGGCTCGRCNQMPAYGGYDGMPADCYGGCESGCESGMCGTEMSGEVIDDGGMMMSGEMPYETMMPGNQMMNSMPGNTCPHCQQQVPTGAPMMNSPPSNMPSDMQNMTVEPTPAPAAPTPPNSTTSNEYYGPPMELQLPQGSNSHPVHQTLYVPPVGTGY
ncbi:hypothetical protein [Planctomicrobium piriforme]|uniref:Uncharacterized protein n=1 Tax=Planctomicrobium piriforme TaxID=1576369 RepID=A0A1I3EQD2_9PLAN|nr:hypothetical protein [Planctomicrobium piriforme]SFI01197.1 hypothetical protein SAMN05421753_104329 [Planctomicrobium piriforme]